MPSSAGSLWDLLRICRIVRLLAYVSLTIPGAVWAQGTPTTPSPAAPAAGDACQKLEPKACLALAFDAMGGRSRLEGLRSLGFTAVSHTALVEQSYRQEPFITAYERLTVRVD